MQRIFRMMVASVAVAATVAAQEPSPVPAVGSPAPTFRLPSEAGKQVTLEQYRGKWVVLYFYPKDFTSGCTLEAHNFQRDLAQYTKKKAVVLGVSLDSVDSHQGFCSKEGLHFKLLSDADHAVATQYGALMTHNGTLYASRTTFLIDRQGIVRKVYDHVDPSKHSEEVLAALDSLQALK
jgi:thioredoxin-dependent peroxiredoxin